MQKTFIHKTSNCETCPTLWFQIIPPTVHSLKDTTNIYNQLHSVFWKNWKIMRKLFFLLFMQSFLSLLISLEPSEKFDGDLFLHNTSSVGRYRLFWKVVDPDQIIFEVHVKTLGWIGLGFSQRRNARFGYCYWRRSK